jgi:hypothetical protein
VQSEDGTDDDLERAFGIRPPAPVAEVCEEGVVDREELFSAVHVQYSVLRLKE